MSSGRNGSRGRPSAISRRARVFYDKDALLNLLQQFCPEIMCYFPPPDSFATYRGINLTDRGDQFMIALLEIGRVWPASGDHEARRAVLCVWDKGGFTSDGPDLVPYSTEGHSERILVGANGFDATGVFAELRESRTPRQNPVLDDPLVIALFQFIMILRNNRRYYWYGYRHWESAQEHIAPLVEALHVVTRRWRQLHRYPGGPRQVLAGRAMPFRQPPPPFASSYQPPTSHPSHEMQLQPSLPTSRSQSHGHGSMDAFGMLPPNSLLPRMPPRSPMPRPLYRRLPQDDSRLEAKHLVLSTEAGTVDPPSPQDSVVSSDVDNEPKGYFLVTTEVTNRAAGIGSSNGGLEHQETEVSEDTVSLRSTDQIQQLV